MDGIDQDDTLLSHIESEVHELVDEGLADGQDHAAMRDAARRARCSSTATPAERLDALCAALQGATPRNTSSPAGIIAGLSSRE